MSGFSQPFTLEGLFGAADAGAFEERVDVQMNADEGEDDNQEPMQEDGSVITTFFISLFMLTSICLNNRIEMISDDLAPHIPRKRSRSPSTAATDELLNQNPDPSFVRQTKRQRRAKDIPSYDAPPDHNILQQMARSNPLSRRVLKREAKRARKTHRVNTAGAGRGMDIDDEGLQSTFMA